MAMDSHERDALQGLIDSAISKVPDMLAELRKDVKKELKVTNDIDYLMGYLVAYLLQGYIGAYVFQHQSPPPPQIYYEAHLMIYNSLKDFRNTL